MGTISTDFDTIWEQWGHFVRPGRLCDPCLCSRPLVFRQEFREGTTGAKSNEAEDKTGPVSSSSPPFVRTRNEIIVLVLLRARSRFLCKAYADWRRNSHARVTRFVPVPPIMPLFTVLLEIKSRSVEFNASSRPKFPR